MKSNYTTYSELFQVKARKVSAEKPGKLQILKQEALKSQTHFNHNTLRRERLYTKLKYSRCPQYDIVSGGFAALLSAFIGFLISEKFGIELVDSGDFYVAFMYGVFLTFSTRPLLRITSRSELSYSPWGYSIALNFISSICEVTARLLLSLPAKISKIVS